MALKEYLIFQRRFRARYKDMNDLLWYEVQKNPAKWKFAVWIILQINEEM